MVAKENMALRLLLYNKIIVEASRCQTNLAYPSFARLRESAEKRVWQQMSGLIVT